MRAALWGLLAVSGAQARCESVRFIDSRSAPCVLSLSGGGTIAPGEEGQVDRNIKLAAQPLASSERRSRRAVAWCVPWLARRRRQARGKGADNPRGRAVVPAADPAGKMTPEAAFSSALASFVGAMIVSGGTLGMWPQSVAASPFDPRPPPNSVRQPFFEGWFIRLVDHEQRLSFAVIFGSFRTRGETELDQHYVSLSYLHEPKGGILPVEVEEEDLEEAAGGSYEGGGDANAAPRQGRPSEIAKRFSRWIREQRLAVLRGVGTEGAGDGFGDPKGFPEKGGGASEGGENIREKIPGNAGGGGVDANGNYERTRGLRDEDGEDLEGELESESDVAARGSGEGDSGRESEGGGKAEADGKEQEPPPATVREGDNSGGDGGAAGDSTGNRLEQAGPEDFAGERDADADAWGFEGEEVRRADEDGWEENSVQGRDGDDDDVRDSQPDTRPRVAESEGEGPGAGTGTRGGGKAAPGTSGGGGGGGNGGVLRPGLAKGGDGGEGRSSTQDAPHGGFIEQPGQSSPRTPQPKSGPRFAETSRSTGERGEEGEEDAMRTWTYHAFPPAETVTISRRGEPVDSLPDLVDDPDFTWEADGIGSFTVDGDTGRLSFQLPELSVAASFRRRVPWSEDRPNAAGPEGWLQKTGLLPLHYFVYSMGSEAGYSLKATDAPRAVVGRGSMHMEANYGESFPTGWVWAQGCSATEGLYGNVFQDGEPTDGEPTDGESTDSGSGSSTSNQGDDGKGVGDGGDEEPMETPARFVLTGGRFVIGPVTTNSFVMAFRSKEHSWNFRSTDLDRIKVKASRTENRLKLVARSWGGKRVLKADIHAPGGSFGSAIYVPTPEGFSNAPGCVESYAATATFRLYTKGDKEDGDGVTRPLVLREEVEFKLAALEFGGDFQDT